MAGFVDFLTDTERAKREARASQLMNVSLDQLASPQEIVNGPEVDLSKGFQDFYQNAEMYKNGSTIRPPTQGMRPVETAYSPEDRMSLAELTGARGYLNMLRANREQAMPFRNQSEIVDMILKHEGGVANRGNEADPGGLTNMGVTLPTLSAYLGRQATREQLLNLDRDTAEKIILSHSFGQGVRGRDITGVSDINAQAHLADISTMHSPRTFANIVQRAVNRILPRNEQVQVDGQLGPNTVKAINEAIDKDPEAFHRALYESRVRALRQNRRASLNPGWFERAKDTLSRVLPKRSS